MAKRRREIDCDSAMAECQAAFVDTSLDTRFAIAVSMSDTVSDFKRKMVLEHMQFYPEVGEIQIHSLKAKRRGNFYPLSDHMLVSSAFHGVKGNWFLSADVSSTLDKKSLEPGASEGLKMDAGSTSDDECGGLSSDMNMIVKNLNSEMTIGLEVEKSSKVAQDLQRNSYLVEDCLEDYRPKKKLRMSQHADVSDSHMLEDNDTLIHESVNVTSQLEIVGCENSVVNVVKDSPEGILNFAQEGTHFIPEAAIEGSSQKNDQPDTDDRVALEGGVVPAATGNGGLGSAVNLETPLPFDRRKENIVLENIISENPMTGKFCELGKNDQTALSEGVTVEEPNLATGLVDSCGTLQDFKSNGNRKKKKKAKKIAAKVQDTPDMEHEVRKGDSIEETYLPVVPEKSSLGSFANSQNILASENIMLESLLDQNVQTDHNHMEDNTFKEPRSVDSCGTMQDGETFGNKLRKTAKRTASKIQDISNLEHENTKDRGFEEACVTSPTERSAANFQNILAADGMKENTVLESVVLENSKAVISVNELVINVRAEPSQDMTVSKTDVSMIDISGIVEAAKSDGRTKKKKKAKKTASGTQDICETTKDKSVGEACGIAPTEKGVEDSQNILTSDGVKENIVLESVIPVNSRPGVSENELGKNVNTEHPLDMTVNQTYVSPVDMRATMEDAKSDGRKRKKKKSKKNDAKIQDSLDEKHETGKDEFLKPYTETHRYEKNEEDCQLSLDHDQLISSLCSQILDHVDPDMKQKGANFSLELLGANRVTGPELREKKKRKKSADSNLEKSGMELTNYGMNGTSVSLFPSTDHIPEVNGCAESIVYHEDRDVQTKVVDHSSVDAIEKVQSAIRNETNSVILTQSEQPLEDVGSQIKHMGLKNQSSVNSYTDFLVLEEENKNVESNQTEKNGESNGSKHKKDKKKGKKNQLPASDAQGTLPINDQKVGNEFLATEENSNSFMNPEQEQGLIASSQILSDKNQEKPEEMHETAVTTDDQGINFKQYFVQDAVASGNKVKEATKSIGKMKTKKKVESHNLPLVSTSSQSNSLRSGGNQKSENKSRVKSRRHGDSAMYSDSNEAGHKAIHTSSRDSGIAGQGYSLREKQEIMTTEKHNEIFAASSFSKEKKTSLVKSSSERSKISPENRDKRRQSGLDVNSKMLTRATLKKSLFAKPRYISDDNSVDSHGTNKMVMKTPAKKSLLTKPGSIFQDNSGEGSGDENESVHSDASTRSPSDNSSQSEGESDLSEHSTRNGSKLSNGGNGRLTNRNNMSKLDLSASKDFTMDMILRSSKQFKKTKKLLSSQTDLEQNDSQQIEFVPDSQPNP